MRKQVIENAAHEVATQIRTVEDCIEDALVEIADLQSKMLRARAAAGIATATGHAAFEQLAIASRLGRGARRHAQCHGAGRRRSSSPLRTVAREGDECR